MQLKKNQHYIIVIIANFLENLSVDQFIVAIILATMLLVQLIFYVVIYAQPVYRKAKSITKLVSDPVSVIICAKNEAANLRQFLPKILEQSYNDFEVIVVNDCSEDETEMLLAELEQKYSRLRHTTIEPDRKFGHGKKLAVIIGIKSAKHERLVFTDADCYPTSKNWLQEVVAAYNDTNDIVLGYGKYAGSKGLLNRIIRFDSFMIALQYMGLAILGKPYMGVGRNLSYKKKLFFEGKGFGSHYHILSGDDDLFINEHSTRKNTAVVLSKDSFTVSIPPNRFVDWIKQKKRHLTTAYFYKTTDKIILGLEPITKLLFYLAVIYLSFTQAWMIGLAAYTIRLIVQLVIIKLGMMKLNENGFLFLIPILDVFIPVFQLSLIFSNKINARNRKWN